MTSTTPNAAAAESAVRQIGKEFRRFRDLRGERIEDIATYLDIKPTYLFGIEQGDLSVIPSKHQAKAMVQGYADYLGLDGKSIIEPMDPIISSLEGDIAPSEHRQLGLFDRTSALVLAGSVVLGMLVGWSWIGDVNQFDLIAPPVTADVVSLDAADDDAVGESLADVAGLEAEIAELQDVASAQDGGLLIADDGGELSEEAAEAADALLAELKTAIADDAGVIADDAETVATAAVDTVEPVQGKKDERPANVLAALVAERGDGAHIYEAENTDARVIVRALNDVLVQVTSQSRDYVWTQTMKQREMLLVPSRDDLELWTGDAGGIEILLDGTVLPLLGAPGTSISGLSLEASSLEALSEPVSENGTKPTF